MSVQSYLVSVIHFAEAEKKKYLSDTDATLVGSSANYNASRQVLPYYLIPPSPI